MKARPDPMKQFFRSPEQQGAPFQFCDKVAPC